MFFVNRYDVVFLLFRPEVHVSAIEEHTPRHFRVTFVFELVSKPLQSEPLKFVSDLVLVDD